MITAESLVAGRVYFTVTYTDSSGQEPIVASYLYLGKDVYGQPLDPSESSYDFKLLAPYDHCDPETADEQTLSESLHWFASGELGLLCDLGSLIEELCRQPAHPVAVPCTKRNFEDARENGAV